MWPRCTIISLCLLGMKSLVTKISLFSFLVAGIFGRSKLLRRCSPPQLMRQMLDLATGEAHFSGIGYFKSLEARPPRRGALAPTRGTGRPRKREFDGPSVAAVEQETIHSLELAYVRTLELQALVTAHCDLLQRRSCVHLPMQPSTFLGYAHIDFSPFCSFFFLIIMVDFYSLVLDLLRVGVIFVPVGVSLPPDLVVVADLRMQFHLQSACGLKRIRWTILWSYNFVYFGCHFSFFCYL